MTIIDFREAEKPTALIDQTYALVRTIWPAVTLADWRLFATHQLHSDERGLLALAGADAYITGLCGYERSLDLGRGAVLRVPLLLVFDMVDGASLADVLLDTLQQRSRQLACHDVHVHLRTGQNAVRRHLVKRGFLEHGTCFRC